MYVRTAQPMDRVDSWSPQRNTLPVLTPWPTEGLDIQWHGRTLLPLRRPTDHYGYTFLISLAKQLSNIVFAQTICLFAHGTHYTGVATAVLLNLNLAAKNTTKSSAVAGIADRTGRQWPSSSSKVRDFHLIWKGLCDFLLMIYSNLNPISDRFRDTATYSLKISLKLRPNRCR